MKMKLSFIILLVLIVLTKVNAQSTNKIFIDDDIQLIKLKDSAYIHVSWHVVEPWGRIPSNGLILIKNGQALLIDTPMDNEKTKRLYKFLEDSMQVIITKLIIGHHHADCMGGLSYLKTKNIESIAGSLTVEKCKELDLPNPSKSFTDSLIFSFNEEEIICRYFGGGHSVDNITVWIPGMKILFGGCLIKEKGAKNIGYTGEAVMNEWDITVQKIINFYSDIEIVVPGHGHHGGVELLTNTIELVMKSRTVQPSN